MAKTKISLKQIDTRAPKTLDKEKTKNKTKALLEELDGLQIYYTPIRSIPY
jgi:hypothetical protein